METLTLWTLISIAILFVILLVIGYSGYGKTKTLADFYIGGRKIGLWITAFSYVATWNSAVTYLGAPGLGYTYGLGLMGLAVVGSVGPGLVGFVLLAKRLRIQTTRLNALTIPDYIEGRYQSVNTRIIATISILIFTTVYLVAQLLGISYLWEVLIGIPYHYGIIIYAIIIATYTAIGGYFSVAWTDLFQGIVMTAIAIAVIPFTLIKFGGWTNLHELGVAAMGTEYNSMPGLFGTFFWITITFYTLGSLGSPQLHQRLFALKDWKVVRWGAFLTTLIAFVQIGSMIYGGYGARVAEYQGLIPQGAIDPADTAMPNYLKYCWPTSIIVLFTIGVMSASMSTSDSLLLVCSQAVGRDLYQKLIGRWMGKEISDKTTMTLTRFVVFGIAFLAVVAAWRTVSFLIVISSMQLTVVGGTFMPAVILGCWWKRGTKWGAIASMLGGLISAVAFYTVLKPYIPEPFFPTMVISFGLYIIVSKLTKPLPQELIEKMFAPPKKAKE